jgi:hypothetical protein
MSTNVHGHATRPDHAQGATADAAPTSAQALLKPALRGMDFDEGAALLKPPAAPSSPNVQLLAAGAVVQMEPGDTVPADLDTARPVGAAVAEDIRTRIMTAVRRSPHMVALLRDIEANGGAAFAMKWSNRGTYHSAGEIWIARDWTIGSWVTSLCHELSHLLDHRRGVVPNVATSASRDEFVRVKLEQEVRAHAIHYAAQYELESQSLGLTLASPLGYNEFRPQLQAAEGGAGRRLGAAQVQTMATTWLAEQYRTNPVFFTSNTNENYYTYWGRIWDEAHPGGR